uniref:Cationic amino acid transporter C-terminal domain-containing protein n=1 Tax=Timema tahoe TaxID=61484 RepID=A0A7R9FKT3_9NEOP|nr:unnamed protein product [Timema tahoe]
MYYPKSIPNDITPQTSTGVIIFPCVGIMASLFDLKHLVDMMSIGTLMAYSIVAACVMLLRYEEDENSEIMISVSNSELSGIIGCGCLTAIIVHAGDEVNNLNVLAITGLAIFSLVLISIITSIALQPTSSKELSFTVPFVPFLPGLSILINIYLMMSLDSQTWIRFIVWMIVGESICYNPIFIGRALSDRQKKFRNLLRIWYLAKFWGFAYTSKTSRGGNDQD